MDSRAFDGLTRLLAGGASRRGLIGALGALTAGGSLGALLGGADTDAKRKRKKKKKRKKKNNQPPPPPAGPTCTDGVKNGSETDVDCGGGTCARCGAGQICTSRNDCTTGLCTGGTCLQCVLSAECGKESDGLTDCACRDTPTGQRICTNSLCNFFMGGTCASCLAGEQCTVAGGGIECCLPCGTPHA